MRWPRWRQAGPATVPPLVNWTSTRSTAGQAFHAMHVSVHWLCAFTCISCQHCISAAVWSCSHAAALPCIALAILNWLWLTPLKRCLQGLKHRSREVRLCNSHTISGVLVTGHSRCWVSRWMLPRGPLSMGCIWTSTLVSHGHHLLR